MIIKETENLFLRAKEHTGITYRNMTVIELGNIIIKNCLDVNGKMTAKDWFIKKGIKNHISIDINGKDGALKLDLGTRLPQFDNTADFLTNGGTAEHVENIYECYHNMHKWTKVGGIMVCWSPITCHAFKHSPWGLKLHFPYKIAELNGYSLLEADIYIPIKGRNPEPMDNSLLGWIWKKNNDNEFISRGQFDLIEGLTRR